MSGPLSLRIHQIGRHIRVLGPGDRYVIWVQGCKQRCEGCVAPDAQPLEGGREIPVQALAEEILAQEHTDGLTISGGEPFLQAEALTALLEAVHARRDLGVIMYTGYLLEALRAGELPYARELLGHVDLLIDGPYVQALNDNGALRGSSNQRIIALTDRYVNDVGLYGEPGKRDTQLIVADDGFFLAGVPTKATYRLISAARAREEKRE